MGSEASRQVSRWLQSARTGSSEALGELLETCRDYLLLIARQELDADLQAKGGASDLVQQTFLEAYKDFERFHGTSEEELRAWLRKLLLNNLANFTRHFRHRSKRSINREVALSSGDSGNPLADRLAARDASPSKQALATEETRAVAAAIKRLPDDYREVVLLRFQGELSFEEIGRQMDRSANAARKLWARAIERLQQEMEASL